MSVSDINLGIKRIYDNIINPSSKEAYKLVIMHEENEFQPDLIAQNCLNDQNLWHYFLFTNGIDNPFTELARNWAFGVVRTESAISAVNTTESTLSNANGLTSRIGTVITLN